MGAWPRLMLVLLVCGAPSVASANVCGPVSERFVVRCAAGSCTVRVHLASVLLPDRCETRPVFSATHPTTSAAVNAYVRERHGRRATGVFDVLFQRRERGVVAIGDGPFETTAWEAADSEVVRDVDTLLEALRDDVRAGERERVMRLLVLSAIATLLLVPMLLAPFWARRRRSAGRAPLMTPHRWLGVAFAGLVLNFVLLAVFCPPYWTRPLMLVTPLALWAAAGTKLFAPSAE